ncbi:MAG: efflux RND transporter periplasmic adaptor subunit [Patescibacteria group bacterium]|nr:efflux RND transporter periplasmic adaptor subunit [Patescibacteria group bacterium]MBU1876894.1 efflux RND transporter periplasmic adaptor subunit [Patescibacteria group bacterium]
MNKKIILTIGIIAFLIVLFMFFSKPKESSFSVVEVYKGNISEEVSETGKVTKGETINVSFNGSGRIEKIYVQTGEDVGQGDILARLEKSQLQIQLQEAQANLSLYQSQLNKLLTGAIAEQIQVSQTAVQNKEISLKNTQQSLINIKAQAEEDLNASYEDALSALNDAFIKADNAYNTIDLIQRTYFTKNDQESLAVREKKEDAGIALSQIKNYIDSAQNSFQESDIDLAVIKVKDNLLVFSNVLTLIRENCESIDYRNTVTSTDKTSLDNHRSYINTVQDSVIASQQTLTSTKLSNKTAIDKAEAEVLVAQGQLKAAQDDFFLLTAQPRSEDVKFNQAQVDQANAKVNLLEKQIKDSVLISPINGRIAKIQKEVGEQVQSPSIDFVFSIIPQAPFQIEVDIPEVDIDKIIIGNKCRISLDAFPEQKLSGQVIEIEPAETVIGGVVYYKIKVSINEENSKIKSGMTANVVIVTDSKENVLIVPQRAVTERDDKQWIKILENNNPKEIEIQTGLKGNKGDIEVISGLNEGQEVITFIKDSD